MLRNASLGSFLDELASSASTPHGGAAAGVSGAMAAGLMAMVANLSTGKRFAEVAEEMAQLAAEADRLRVTFLDLGDRDVAMFQQLLATYRLPQDDAGKKAALAAALVDVTQVPLTMLQTAAEVLALAPPLVERGNSNVLSDVGAGAALARSAAEIAGLNVLINLASREDADVEADRAQAARLLAQVVRSAGEVVAVVRDRLR